MGEFLEQSFQKALNFTLRVKKLEEQSLYTVFCEIEAIISSRPIVNASMDPNDLDALIPNNLLLLEISPTLAPRMLQSSDIYVHRRWTHKEILRIPVPISVYHMDKCLAI